MKKITIQAVIILIVILTLYAVINQSNEIVDIGDSAYNFQLMDVNDNIYSLDDYKGEIVVLNFFNTWCEPCIEEGPELESFHQEYQDIATLFIINKGETNEQVKQYMENYDYKATYLLDYDLSVSKTYKIVGQPETIIIDKNGIIREHIVGTINKEVLIKKINLYK